MNSLAHYHTLPHQEQDAYQWLVVRGNHLPNTLYTGGRLVRRDRRDGVAYGKVDLPEDPR